MSTHLHHYHPQIAIWILQMSRSTIKEKLLPSLKTYFYLVNDFYLHSLSASTPDDEWNPTGWIKSQFLKTHSHFWLLILTLYCIAKYWRTVSTVEKNHIHLIDKQAEEEELVIAIQMWVHWAFSRFSLNELNWNFDDYVTHDFKRLSYQKIAITFFTITEGFENQW